MPRTARVSLAGGGSTWCRGLRGRGGGLERSRIITRCASLAEEFLAPSLCTGNQGSTNVRGNETKTAVLPACTRSRVGTVGSESDPHPERAHPEEGTVHDNSIVVFR
jgi:hypothetical protein